MIDLNNLIACAKDERFSNEYMGNLLRSYLPALERFAVAEQVPTGWVLVPGEPTLEMQRAFFAAAEGGTPGVVEPRFYSAYLAMLAAIERELPHGERS